jgi:hypothetical protein
LSKIMESLFESSGFPGIVGNHYNIINIFQLPNLFRTSADHFDYRQTLRPTSLC